MKRIYTEAVVLLIAVAMIFSSVAIAANTRESNKMIAGKNKIISDNGIEKQVSFSNVFEDGFESYDDFLLDFPPWIQVDNDMGDTYGEETHDWVNEHEPQSFIIFNPPMTTPPWIDDPEVEPHSGDKYAACFSTVPPDTNDDWLITPKVTIGTGSFFKFWARSYTDQWGKERFRVGISTTDPDPSNFIILSTEPYIEAPVEWTEYSFDLANYEGQDAYLAINCVSADAFFLMVDDVSVTEEGGCDPSVDLEKYVWDEINQEWLDADTIDTALDAPICDDVTFKIVIHNTGDCPLFFINVSDHMHESLKYTGAYPEPDNHWFDDEAKEWRMYWFFPGPLNPDETIEIYVTAHVEGPECSTDYNWAHVGALCEHGIYVEDEDESWVHAYKKSKDLNMPFLQFLHNHPNIFPLLQKLLNTLGL
jgi:hypothetical protein